MATVYRRWYWLFLKAYVICYVSLAGLFIVIDALSNLDEFAKRADGVVEMAQVMGRYYLVEQELFVKSLCGVVAVMAVFFTLVETRRQKQSSGGKRP